MLIIYNALYRKLVNGVLRVMDAPVDLETPNATWQAQRAVAMAQTLASSGCGAYLWPPLTMSQSGTAYNADGYGKQYDLNIGQWPGRPLRWGTAQQIQIANSLFHQRGMLVLEDAVIHQYDGGNRQVYTELGAGGKPDPTLFQKTPACFVPKAAVDDVFDSEGNYSFGDMVSYQNSVPKGYMLNGVIRAMKWRRSRLGLDGMRLDDTKGENVTVTHEMIESLAGWNFGECFVGDVNELEEWVRESGGKSTLDFPSHWIYKAVCEGSAPLTALMDGGLASRLPEQAVRFVDTADTDLNNGENVRWNKLWAYLHMLTTPSEAALVYAGDYELYGLAAKIDNYMWISAMFAIGALVYEYVDPTFLVWSRNGDGGDRWSGGLLCGINSDPVNWRSEWVHTPFGPNRHLHDYTGNGQDLWTNQDGWVYLTLGPNYFGSASNGVAYSPAGVNRPIVRRPLDVETYGSTTDFIDF